MSLIGLLRAAWVAVPAALVCGGAVARQIITVPPGMVLIVTPEAAPGTSTAPVLVESRQAAPAAATPIERIFAEQQAMMDRMLADMNAMFSPMASPDRLFRVMTDQMGMPAQGMVPAAGGTLCEESVSISYSGQNSAPVVKVSRASGGCGPGTGVAPVPAEIAPPPAAHHPNVIEVNDPAPVARPPIRHRT